VASMQMIEGDIEDALHGVKARAMADKMLGKYLLNFTYGR